MIPQHYKAGSCHICHAPNLTPLKANDRKAIMFRAVTSDTKPVNANLELGYCQQCQSVQKYLTPEWSESVVSVYDNYTINHVSGGEEPYIFNSKYGPAPRADILVTHLKAVADLPKQGRFLDFGCGNGNILKFFSQKLDGWCLHALEYSEKWKERVLAIPQVEAFYTSLEDLGDERYDVIVMSHVLEHIPDPSAFLQKLKQHLTPNGVLFIAVPNIRQNPIDMFVLDHCSHFDLQSLQFVFNKAGMKAEKLQDDVLHKELIAVVSNEKNSGQEPTINKTEDLYEVSATFLQQMAKMRDEAKMLRAQHSQFGIFGTATAAIWLAAELEHAQDFYVDEDQSKVGREMFGKPVIAMEQIPQNACVYIPMDKKVAVNIIERAPENLTIDFHFLDFGQMHGSQDALVKKEYAH